MTEPSPVEERPCTEPGCGLGLMDAVHRMRAIPYRLPDGDVAPMYLPFDGCHPYRPSPPAQVASQMSAVAFHDALVNEVYELCLTRAIERWPIAASSVHEESTTRALTAALMRAQAVRTVAPRD